MKQIKLQLPNNAHSGSRSPRRGAAYHQSSAVHGDCSGLAAVSWAPIQASQTELPAAQAHIIIRIRTYPDQAKKPAG
ncbi:hypothetical protein N7462_006254 [Penicillium macrosclerotiorum]|uniref:uncharacterized protein n=1 Tax=Penicillium macrosclerotiorum TaxID=303699 RepID=UPI0025486ABC|nr:uncharacterized protein N7462_006254 [Penicillium macrosclerotiorum]KAJ5683089.1 hypothetical protein N7462_006254 [Penicillium macrosclerotiorum]